MRSQPITMPVLSDTMESGRLVNWLKQPGDPVKKGDLLAEVESDKAVLEVEAFNDGYLAGPLAEVGSEIPVGEEIGYISDAPIDIAETDHPESESTPIETPFSSTREPVDDSIKPHKPLLDRAPEVRSALDSHGRRRISPYARGLARELNIDLDTVKSGQDGAVRSPQILAAALRGPRPNLDGGPAWHYKLFTPMHRAVAENMNATLSTPTFRIHSKLSLEPLRAAATIRHYALTLLLARALALSVEEHSGFNAVYTPEGLAQRRQVDVGIAVDVPGGLLAPVLRDAATQPLNELAGEWDALKEKARQQRLAVGDYQGATVYLSNLGMFESVESFDAIVPLGAAAILAVGAVCDGIAHFTLSCDHRVVFGADAARFMESFSTLINNPGDWIT